MKRPLRIALMMTGGQDWIGGVEYIKNIILALSNLPADVRATFEVGLVCNRQTLNPEFYAQVHPYLSYIYDQKSARTSFTRIKRIQLKISKLLLKRFRRYESPLETFFRNQAIDFVYPYFSEYAGKKTYRTAAWIFDFQHKYLPQFFTAQEIRRRDESFRNMAKYAPTIVLSSQVAQSDFQKFSPQFAYKTKVLSFKTYPLSTWYEGDPQQIQHEYSLPDRFFLVSNQFWQHKNHLLLLQVLKRLQEQSCYPLVVCTGHIYDPRYPGYSDEILQIIHKFNLAKQVFLLGLIPREYQIQLMRRALAIIQPSLFEGWSTVVEDARCLGKPIILSDIPVHVEQNPPYSAFFRRDAPESLASLLADWWEQQLPGPNLELETVARENNLKEVQMFGYRFLELARGV
jgi:glycosyltransferase involved in cell wall biosynthesis